MIKILRAMLMFAVAGIFSCNSTSKPASVGTVYDTTHTGRSSLDWDGIYRGVLPCADCAGIQKTVYLNKDGTYKLKVKYIGRQDPEKEYAGKFNWNDKGNTITINENAQPVSFFVGENRLTQLDMSGNKVTGEHAANYILSKERYAIVEKYWKLIELMGKPIAVDSTFGKEPHIIFKDIENRYIGIGGCNSFSGTYQLSDVNRISISQGMTTQMACPKMDVEAQFLKVLQMADNYNVVGDMLVLNRARMAPLARFKTVYMK